MHLGDYAALGHSELRVSPLALGTMTFDEGFAWHSRDKAASILDRYLDLGGNYLDTGNGDVKAGSQTVVGDYFAQNSIRRDRLVVAARFSADRNGEASGRKAVIDGFERALRRLRTDYLDLYWLNNWDIQAPLEEILAALHDLVQSGKLRYFGISDAPAWKVAHAHLLAQSNGWPPFIGLQIEYSLAARLFEIELIPMARGLGLGVVSHSPLNGGLISGKYTRADNARLRSGQAQLAQTPDEQDFEIVDALIRVAGELDTSTARVALAWAMARPGVSSTVIGVRSMEQLDEDIGALDVQLSTEQTVTLDALTIPSHSLVPPLALREAAPVCAWITPQ
ncbi:MULTISPECIES: aldo/keto reductase [unclassified Rhizobium]|uniref:aldo/keto reductase n=1 Tax=unclassified Rhizobium TaxID=2613769 RepID=UPI000EA8C7B4|nr:MULTISPECIES: aldo/keto reductase [unclassified Rhizobium]AYG68460.1 aldo/keto reductase [Rhizobium sp. CCGE531]AYG74843.1 aldo/keto reductase [Rhizobium sp. CCGE532]